MRNRIEDTTEASSVKTCNKCKDEKLLSEFHKCSSTKDGRQYSCRECQNKTVREWRKNNQSKVKEQNKKFRESNQGYHKEWAKKNPSYFQDHYNRNREKKLSAAKKRYQEKRDEKIAYQTQWQRNNPEKVAARHHRRRTKVKKNDAPGACSKTMAAIYKLRDELKSRTGEDWHVDHTIPIDKGGPHHQDNLQPVPASWNCSKMAMHDCPWKGDYPEWVYEFCEKEGIKEWFEKLNKNS